MWRDRENEALDMRKIFSALALAAWGVGSSVAAQNSMVVVELYTSQGCSSCPPADEILAEVSKRDDVIALGLHVDYWDYLGWRDTLALPAFTERQARFNTIMKSRYRLVTPQMIFQGQDYVAGTKPRKSREYIDMLSAREETAALTTKADGGTLSIDLAPVGAPTKGAEIYLVRYLPKVDVAIKRGENAGRRISYVNTVTHWDTVGTWDGASAASFKAPLIEGGEYAVIVQTQNLGPILVARKVELPGS